MECPRLLSHLMSSTDRLCQFLKSWDRERSWEKIGEILPPIEETRPGKTIKIGNLCLNEKRLATCVSSIWTEGIICKQGEE